MNREDLLLYLQNVKNLEILKYGATQQINIYDGEIAEKNQKIKEARSYFDSSTIWLFILSAVLILAAVGARLFFTSDAHGMSRGFILSLLQNSLPLFFIVLAIIIPWICGAFGDFFSTISFKIKDKKHNANVRKIRPQVISEIKEIEAQKENIKADVLELEKLLAEAYSFDLIPIQFRSLPYVIYMYDYLSTSQQTLQDALLHSHIEHSVQQIMAKLNVIIAQNMQMIGLLKANLLATYDNTAQVAALANDVRLNNHLIRVNNFYMQAKCF